MRWSRKKPTSSEKGKQVTLQICPLTSLKSQTENTQALEYTDSMGHIKPCVNATVQKHGNCLKFLCFILYPCLQSTTVYQSQIYMAVMNSYPPEQYFCFVWERKNRLVIWCNYTASGHAALRFWQVHCLKFNFWKKAGCFSCFAGVNRNGVLVTSRCETYATCPEKHSQYLIARKTRFKSVSLSRANTSTDPPSQHHRGEDVSWGKDIICCWAWKHRLRIAYFLK